MAHLKPIAAALFERIYASLEKIYASLLVFQVLLLL